MYTYYACSHTHKPSEQGRLTSSQERRRQGTIPATSSTTTAVITLEFSCQLQSKLLHILVDILRAKVLLKNVGVGNSNVKEKVKYVPVELSALGSTGHPKSSHSLYATFQ